jgi:hypothetical protein
VIKRLHDALGSMSGLGLVSALAWSDVSGGAPCLTTSAVE